jgi:hypothetical protein
MVSPDGLAIPYAQTNTLILTDSAANVRRILGMLEELDIEGNERETDVTRLVRFQSCSPDLASVSPSGLVEVHLTCSAAGQQGINVYFKREGAFTFRRISGGRSLPRVPQRPCRTATAPSRLHPRAHTM